MNDRTDISLVGFEATGSYRDSDGSEDITWAIGPYLGLSRRQPSFEIRTTIRGVGFWGFDFDGLEADDADAARLAGFHLHGENDLTGCVLAGDLPCFFLIAGQLTNSVIRFELDLRSTEVLRLETRLDDQTIAVEDGWFEDGMLKLAAQLPTGTELSTCVTCLYSDYSPGGHGLTGMSCHRASAERYLAVRSKAEYWGVPITEEVMESHRCEGWTRRIAGTGYRG
jgi:hypothetical protein